MTVIIPFAAIAILVMLVILTVIAKERNYEMTSAGLMVLTEVLVGWFAGVFWMFG
jgi:hypothetical protein